MAVSADSSLPRVDVRFEDLEALQAEVRANLGQGRVFVAGPTWLTGTPPTDTCSDYQTIGPP